MVFQVLEKLQPTLSNSRTAPDRVPRRVSDPRWPAQILGSKNMLLFKGGTVLIDFGMDFLSESLAIMDSRLKEIEVEADRSEDPDAFGYWDRQEYFTGFGFVTCQTYLTSVRGQLGKRAKEAYVIGPSHANGKTVVSLIDAAANYWKHPSEWKLEENSIYQKRTVEILDSVVDVGATSSPTAFVLYELSSKRGRFSAILPFLIQWRDSLCTRARKITGKQGGNEDFE